MQEIQTAQSVGFLTGGDVTKVLPLYQAQADINDPSKPTDTRMIQQHHPKEPFPPQESVSLMFKMFPEKKKPPQMPPQQIYQPEIRMQANPYGLSGTYIRPPMIVNNVNIGAVDPTARHEKMNLIYQDLMPPFDIPTSHNTVANRLTVLSYVRSMILDGNDGKPVYFKKGKNSLLERLKTTEFNPYHYGGLLDNPYSTIPKNMLLYRSCYPIRYNDNVGVTCSNDSVGMNIRIYRLTNKEFDMNKNPSSKFYESDVWREVAYYEYIRENIVKKKICPNFVTMYGYSMCPDSEIDFEQIDKFKQDREYVPPAHHVAIKDKVGEIPVIVPALTPMGFVPIVKIPKKDEPESFIGMMPGTHTTMLMTKGPDLTLKPITPSGLPVGATIMKNPDAYEDKLLIALTEAPTYNIFQWASKKYQTQGRMNNMIHMGYHDEKIWRSILCQLMIAMHILKRHHIYINDFSLADNVYIKDLTNINTLSAYWLYIVDGVKYYVPNYGYIVMIDSKFKDPQPTLSTVLGATQSKRIISSHLFAGEPNQPTDADIDKLWNDAFLNVFNTNNFSGDFERLGGVHPQEEVLSFINRIHSGAVKKLSTDKDINIFHMLYNFMRIFMNNRIGSYLNKYELEYIAKGGSKKFNSGDIIIYEERPETFKFVMYVSSKNPGVVHVITRHDNGKDFKTLDIPSGQLYQYENVPIKQEYKPNEAKLDDSELLETYVIM